jgi:hypothetical protein
MRKTVVWCSILASAVSLAPGTVQAQGHFLRGDSNADKEIDVSDAVFTLLYLFVGSVSPRCLDALDFNDSGEINVTDAIDLLHFAFMAGAPPAAPFPVFEADPTSDALSCLPELPGSVIAGGSIITGNIAVDVTLTPDKTYRLVSSAFFKEGTTLTIEAGVTILCDSATKAYMAVERGARIFAVGTSTHPVVFTSDKPVGQRKAGDWGGVIICGRGPTNFVGGEWVVKGFQNLRAGGGANPDPEESSGRLSYVRFEYTGASVGDASPAPLTAITFTALGSGTQLDHIMAKQTKDDGLEWYGGTCNLRYGLSVAVEDDSVDCEYGWQGHAQFVACIQKPAAGNNGWQIAEDDTQPRLEPLTLPTLCNVTLLGAYASGSRSAYGLRVRRFAGVNLYNGILQGWHDGGISLSTDFGPVSVDRCALYGNTTTCASSTTGACAKLFEAPLQNIVATQTTVVDASNIEDPDLRGIASRLPEPLDPTGIDPWFEPATYAGAVPPEGQGEDWTHESWISWQSK